jgi:hypothetical protein
MKPSFRGVSGSETSPESITTIVSMDSGPAPKRGASRNDELSFTLP